jgi:hypothetical protein
MLTDGLVRLAAFAAGGLLAATAAFCLYSPQLLCSWIYKKSGRHADGLPAITESVSASAAARQARRAINESAMAVPPDVLADAAQMAHTFGPATLPVLVRIQPWSQRVRNGGGRVYDEDELFAALDELARMGVVHKTSTFGKRKEAGYSCHPAHPTKFYNALRKGDFDEARRWS